MIKSHRIKWKKYFWWTFLILFFPFTLLFYWGNKVLGVTRYVIEDKNLPMAFYGFGIVQISDLHNARFGKEQTRLLEKIRKIAPDMIAVTGDLIDSNRTDTDVAMQFIKGAQKIAPVYYVTGNHESRTDEFNLLKERLLSAGVHIADDIATTIEKNDETINVVGLQAPEFTMKKLSFSEKRKRVSQKLGKLKQRTDGYTILLSHHPEYFDEYVKNGFNLVMSGHAHGGQIRIPFVQRGFYSPDQGLFPRYTEGVYKKEKTKMLVSRGLGNSTCPWRINNFPEIVFLTLVNPQKTSSRVDRRGD